MLVKDFRQLSGQRTAPNQDGVILHNPSSATEGNQTCRDDAANKNQRRGLASSLEED